MGAHPSLLLRRLGLERSRSAAPPVAHALCEISHAGTHVSRSRANDMTPARFVQDAGPGERPGGPVHAEVEG